MNVDPGSAGFRRPAANRSTAADDTRDRLATARSLVVLHTHARKPHPL